MIVLGFIESPELLIVLAILSPLLVLIGIVAIAVSTFRKSTRRQLDSPVPSFPEPGWYSDPSGSGTPRRWDGAQWQ